MRPKFLASFPKELLNQATSFEEGGNIMIAWRSESIKAVIHWITKKNAVILGGRMFLDAEGVIFFSGLEWSVERNELDWNEFVQKSAELSLAFIEKNQVHHEKYLYALDFAEEEERILRSRLPMHFPEMLVNSAYLLDTSGYAEVAWKYEEAIQAIYFYTENHYGILGGDVYECNRESGVPTSDSWYYNFQNHDQSEGIENSKNKAIEYIEKYRKRNGDNYCYTLVVRLFHP